MREDERDAPSFLLESVVGGTQTGRYSFLGSRPTMEVMAKEGACSVLDHERGERTRSEVGPGRYCSYAPRYRMPQGFTTTKNEASQRLSLCWRATSLAYVGPHVTGCHVAQRSEASDCEY